MEKMILLDRQLFFWINALQGNPFLDKFIYFSTYLGSYWYAVPMLSVILLLIHRLRAIKAILISHLIVLPLSAILQVWKRWADRPRPPVALGTIVKVIGPLTSQYSFPSGHSFTVFSILGLLWVADRRLAYIWFPIAFLVAFSRVYIGVHFPSDVIAGGLFGFFIPYYVAKKSNFHLYPFTQQLRISVKR